MITLTNTSIRLSYEGRVIEAALRDKWHDEMGHMRFIQVVERALRIAARAEGMDISAMLAEARAKGDIPGPPRAEVKPRRRKPAQKR